MSARNEHGAAYERSRNVTVLGREAGLRLGGAILVLAAAFCEAETALAEQAAGWQAVVATAESSSAEESKSPPQPVGALKLLNGAKPTPTAGPVKDTATPESERAPEAPRTPGTPAAAPALSPAAATQVLSPPSPASSSPPSSPPTSPPAQTPPSANALSGALARDYCKVVLNQAAVAKIAGEKQKVKGMQTEVDKRIGELEKAITEHKDWLRKRQEFLDKAQEVVVKLYAGMPAEAAAQRLSAVTEDMAAAILSKLNAKSGSSILADIEPQRAARITAHMAGAAEIATPPRTMDAAKP